MSSLRKPGRPPDEQLHARRREEILDVAAKVFAERGFTAADTQFVADRCGVSKGTLFRYFPSKQELFLAAMRRGLERLEAWIEQRVPDTVPPEEQLPRVLHAYLEFFAMNPEIIELMALERAHFKNQTPTYFSSINCEFEERWDRLTLDLMERGHYRRMPLDQFKTVVGDLVYGTMFTNYVSGRAADPAEQAAAIVDVLFHGILGRPATDRQSPTSTNSPATPTSLPGTTACPPE